MHILILTSRITFHFQQKTSQNSDFFPPKRTPAFASLHNGWREKYGPQWLGMKPRSWKMGGWGNYPKMWTKKKGETAFPTNSSGCCHLPLNRSFEKFRGTCLASFFFPKSSDSGSLIGVDIWNLKWHDEKKNRLDCVIPGLWVHASVIIRMNGLHPHITSTLDLGWQYGTTMDANHIA